MKRMPGRRQGIVIVGVFSLGLATVEAAERVDFNREIRPILSNACFKCHGPDVHKREAGLRFDSRDGAVAKLKSDKRAIVPGQSAESELLRRVTAHGDEKMPPAAEGKDLTPEQIALLKRWIDEGAEYKGHWSFIKPIKPVVPVVKHKEFVANPIDAFLLARLEKDSLGFSSPADKVTLVRRLTYDLTGLPPTPQEVDAFLADVTPQAYEKLVDRLLGSTRYGEHMARHWLDAARYGDTHGLHLDNERSIWPYRDWVIKAFNNNLAFNQFTIEQLAGDLLPNPTQDQRVATGFNRCNVTTGEGGSIDDEVLVRYAVDRVETTSTVWMGLTLGCAVCHDHKYDPVSQKEFYQLYAFFNSTQDAAMDGNQLLPPPSMKLPTPEQENQLKGYDQQIAKLNEEIRTKIAKIDYKDPTPTATIETAKPTEFVWVEDELPKNAKEEGGWKFVTKKEFSVQSGERCSYRQASGLSQHFFTGANPAMKIGAGDVLFAYVYLDAKNPPKQIMLQFNDGSWEHRAYWGANSIEWGAENTPARVAMGPLPKAGQWVRLEVPADKVGLKPGANVNGWAFTQFDGAVYWDKAGLVTKTPQAGQAFESLALWESNEKAQPDAATPADVKAILAVAADKRDENQKKRLREHFLTAVYSKSKEAVRNEIQQLADTTKKRNDLDASLPVSMVMADMPQRRDAYVLIRGQYDKKGEKVGIGVPASLGKLPEGVPQNRLGLAKWLVSPDHPLTARVTVNRFWQQFFGVGLVKTAEDFGSQGAWPTHPELLDWLATDFVENQWNIKRLVRQIVMSSAYRQTSKVTPELLQKDPANELLARSPRYRHDAEVVRDSALFISGLLVEKVGGRSVKPYQPDGLWEAVAFQGSNTQFFKQDQGEALYRRSMYTFWKRTSPPPSLMAFDAPSRENCTVRRARTNTPLQALALMNDKQYVEAARFLAQRVLSANPDVRGRLELAFRLCIARAPSSEEVAVLQRVLDSQLQAFRADKTFATKLIDYGDSKAKGTVDPVELAAYTMVANTLMNLDETVTRE